MRQSFDYSGKRNQKRVLVFGENFLFEDLLSEAHSVRLFYRSQIYVNLGNGMFACAKDPRRLLSSREVYQSARTVMDSHHCLIAKRLRFLDQSKPLDVALIKSDPCFSPDDYELRRIRFEYC